MFRASNILTIGPRLFLARKRQPDGFDGHAATVICRPVAGIAVHRQLKSLDIFDMDAVAAFAASWRALAPVVPQSGKRRRNEDAARDFEIAQRNRDVGPTRLRNDRNAPRRAVLFD